MTPAERAAMVSSWRKLHEYYEWLMDSPSPAFERGFTAGLAHAREQAAEQLEARAAEIELAVSGGGVSGVGMIPDALREQAAKIRTTRSSQ